MTPIQERSEDSLYLNIWRPNNNQNNLPILVYIHGGSLTSGTSAFEDYNGEEHTVSPNKAISFTFYNYLTGNLDIAFDSELSLRELNEIIADYKKYCEENEPITTQQFIKTYLDQF